MPRWANTLLAGIAATGACVGGLAWQDHRLTDRRRQDLGLESRVVARQFASRVQGALERHAIGLRQVANFWENSQEVAEPEFYEFASSTVELNPLCLRVSAIDPTLRVRWVYPPSLNRSLIGFDVRTHPEGYDTFLRARDTRQTALSPPLRLVGGARGFVLTTPIFKKDEFHGAVACSFRSADFFDAVVLDEVAGRYHETVVDSGTVLFASVPGPSSSPSAVEAVERFSLGGRGWELVVWPRPEVVSERLDSGRAIFWVLGSLAALLVGFLAGAGADRAIRTAARLRSQGAALEDALAAREEALGKRELDAAYLSALIHNSPIAIGVHDLDGRIQLLNPAFEELFQYPLAEANGRYLDELVAPADRTGEAAEMTRSVTSGRSVRATSFRRRRDGTLVEVDVYGVPLVVRGEVVGGYGLYQDITERRIAERALQESEERYRLLFERNPQPMWVYDLETLRFLAANAAAERAYGYSQDEFLEMTIKDIRPAEEVERFLEDVAQTAPGLHAAGTWKHVKKDASIIEVEVTSHDLTFAGRPARLVLATNVTERRSLEEQLRQSQKMEAIGRLAGGIAHDFNNLLGVMMGYGEILLAKLPGDDPQRGKLEQIVKAAERAATLTRQLLAFSRKQVVQPKVLNLNVLLSEMEKMLRRLIGEDVELATREGADLGRVKADPGQVEQIIMNLVVNARDAMPSGGNLIIETANVWLDEGYARVHSGVRPGPYVMVAVSDTGIGMTPEVKARLFEPFFTTKELGKGTGLGLATVYGIVKQSGGNIWVYSEPRRGTTFKIYLPRVDEAAEELGSREVANSPRGTETLLVVEDEDALREMIDQSLQAYGYQVLATGHVEGSEKLAGAHHGPIHLLITDVVLPGMGGRDLARKLVEKRPDMKVLYMSGYTDDAIAHHGIVERGVAFLEKPFPLTRLARKVREVLDGKLDGAA